MLEERRKRSITRANSAGLPSVAVPGQHRAMNVRRGALKALVERLAETLLAVTVGAGITSGLVRRIGGETATTPAWATRRSRKSR